METNTNPLKYKQIEQEIRKLIQRSKVEDKLPPERELAQMFECNFLTVRKGLRPLVTEGLLRRRVGSGTFIVKIPAPPGTSRNQGVDHLGLLIPSSGDLYSYRVVRAVADAALQKGLELRSAWIKDFAASARTTAKDMANGGCKALIVPWFHACDSEAVRKFVQGCSIPVVLPQLVPGLEHLCFEKQDVFGKSALLEVDVVYAYFLRLGAKNIHFLGPEQVDAPILQQKVTAYARAASRAGREAKFGLVGPDAASMSAYAESAAAFAGNLAVIAYDDAHAARFLTAMHKRGLEAPRDFRVVGHNDTSVAWITDPPLSTLRQNFDYIGQAMLRAAAALARGKSEQSPTSPDPELIVRGTCGGAETARRIQIPRLTIHVETKPGEALLVTAARDGR